VGFNLRLRALLRTLKCGASLSLRFELRGCLGPYGNPGAPAQMRQFGQKLEALLASLKPQMEIAAKKLAQAQADYSLLE
jgi:hypothetical protein